MGEKEDKIRGRGYNNSIFSYWFYTVKMTVQCLSLSDRGMCSLFHCWQKVVGGGEVERVAWSLVEQEWKGGGNSRGNYQANIYSYRTCLGYDLVRVSEGGSAIYLLCSLHRGFSPELLLVSPCWSLFCWLNEEQVMGWKGWVKPGACQYYHCVLGWDSEHVLWGKSFHHTWWFDSTVLYYVRLPYIRCT